MNKMVDKYGVNKVQYIDKISIHHQTDFPSSIYSIIQLDTGEVVLGLSSGEVYFFSQNNLNDPYFSIQLDPTPIHTIIQLSSEFLLCSSGKPALYLLTESKAKKGYYDKKDKLDTNNNLFKQVNKMILLLNDNLITVDYKFISLWNLKGKKIKLLKQIKIGFPIMDILNLKDNTAVCAVPQKQSLIFFDTEKFIQKYEILNIKFLTEIYSNSILAKLQKNMLFIGGCVGGVYLINLKNKQLVANIKLKFKDETITAIYKMDSDSLVCGVSALVENNEGKGYKILSDLVQYKYDGKSFNEICRKCEIHEDFIRSVVEIMNHMGISEIGTISFDKTFKVWN